MPYDQHWRQPSQAIHVVIIIDTTHIKFILLL
jgi:hypothetical protein